MALIKQLKDVDSNVNIYPVTHTDAVRNGNGKTMTQVLAEFGMKDLIATTNSTVELVAGVVYRIGTTSSPCSSLTITLGTPIDGKANEYHAVIYCDDDMVFNYPQTVKIVNDLTLPTFESGHLFEIHIFENIMNFSYTTL